MQTDITKKYRDILLEEEYTYSEKQIVNMLNDMGCWHGRRIVVGIGESYPADEGLTNVCLAWTDGFSYICITRLYLEYVLRKREQGGIHLFSTLIHELAHDADLADTIGFGINMHSSEFDKRFRELCEHKISILRYLSMFMNHYNELILNLEGE